jgi:glycine/serine hydroxymethyltransferase
MDAPEMRMIGGFIDEILSNIGNDAIVAKVRAEVTDLTMRYPPPGY